MEEKKERNFVYYVKRYFNELLEASVGLFIIYLLSNKNDINVKLLLRNIAIFAFVTLIVEEYNPEYSSNIKQGVTFTIGSNLLAG